MKLQGPKSIAFRIALIATLFVAVVLLLIHYPILGVPQIWREAIDLLLLFITIFFVSKSYINNYLHRRISFIYREFIGDKSNKEPKTGSKKTLVQLEQDLVDWKLKQNEEVLNVEKLELYRREYVGNVSHELKTPVFLIQGYLETLLEGAIEDQEIAKDFLSKALNSTERLTAIANDLNTINLLESSSFELKEKCFEIYDFVDHVIDDMQQYAHASQMSLIVEKGSRASMFVKADPEMMEQVLVHLISNAVKYRKANDGEVVVTVRELDYVVFIQVKDDGLGMQEEELPKIFNRFYRIERSRSNKIPGTGLGLSIVKHIVEAHHQKLNVKSEFGIGSSFSFTLPKCKKEGTARSTNKLFNSKLTEKYMLV